MGNTAHHMRRRAAPGFAILGLFLGMGSIAMAGSLGGPLELADQQRGDAHSHLAVKRLTALEQPRLGALDHEVERIRADDLTVDRLVVAAHLGARREVVEEVGVDADEPHPEQRGDRRAAEHRGRS